MHWKTDRVVQATEAAADVVGMTPPRQIIRGKTVMITVQATGRSFRFLPTKKVGDTILYVLAAALEGLEIDIHEFCFLSNHFHIVLTPRKANLPKFTQKFHSNLSRALNAIRGTRGANIEKDYNIVVEEDPEAILRACAYTLANPVKAHLVSRIRQWKGPNSFSLEYGQELRIERPNYGLWKPVDTALPSKNPSRPRKKPWEATRRSFRGRWKSPEVVTLKLTRPPVFTGELSDAQLRNEIRRRALEKEGEAERERSAAGRKALGMKRVLKQSFLDIPGTRQDLFGPVPKVSAASRWAKKAALQRCREFVARYREALREWMAGNLEVEFPAGTYLMRERFGVRCTATAPG